MLNLIEILIIFIGVCLFLLIILKRNEIQSFFWPGLWAEVTMLESDNNIRTWLQPKNPDLRFRFNDGLYNMFEIRTDGSKNNSSVYRVGRLAKFFYIEGNENPLDFRNLSITGNPQLNNQMLRLDISKLFEPDTSLIEDFLKRYGIYILIAIVIILVTISMLKGDAQPVQQVVTNG